jgi:hypothetical protein
VHSAIMLCIYSLRTVWFYAVSTVLENDSSLSPQYVPWQTYFTLVQMEASRRESAFEQLISHRLRNWGAC